MPAINPSQARVIDPVLTSIAQGWQNNDFVGSALFPQVTVGTRAGKVISFGKEDFMLYGTARAPGENTKRIGFGYSDTPFALLDYSVEGALPVEVLQEAAAQAKGFSIDMAAMTLNKVRNIMALRLEKQQADLARAAANYGASNKVTLSGTAQWSDYSGTSNPVNVVETAKDAIRSATGKRPNTMVMGAAVLSKLRAHPVIVDRLKYTGRDVATPELLASLFGVQRVLIGEAIVASDAGVFSDVWGKDVVLAYTDTATVADMGAPSYGYTYNLNGYPQAEEPYYDRNSKTWYFPVSTAEAPVIAAASAGYLITNAVA